MECWNIFRNHTPGTYGNAPADCDARTDCYVASEPTIFTNCYRASEFRAIDSVTEERIERVCGGKERAIGAYESPGTNSDEAGIQEGAIEVDIDSFAESNTVSLIHVTLDRRIVERSQMLTDIPQVCSVVDFDRSIYVWLVLEKDGIFLVAGSWRRDGRMIIHNTVTCQSPEF